MFSALMTVSLVLGIAARSLQVFYTFWQLFLLKKQDSLTHQAVSQMWAIANHVVEHSHLLALPAPIANGAL
jgi:peroxiredoxin family protein